MTPKQMYRAMRKWGISLIYDFDNGIWYATHVNEFDPLCHDQSGISALTPDGKGVHVGPTPESAVADYCNARDLEWDV